MQIHRFALRGSAQDDKRWGVPRGRPFSGERKCNPVLLGVDPKRGYVCGHSVGGTLALLAAMASGRFRAAAAFSGSPDQVMFCRGCPELVPFDRADPRENEMRSRLAYPRSFKCPVRIYSGSAEFMMHAPGEATAAAARKAGLDVQAVVVPGDHETAVPPAIARAIVFFGQNQ